jgi:hypothetical protein
MSESDFEREVVQYVESLGGRAPKLINAYGNGFPDRTLLLPKGHIVFTELKTARGQARKMQDKWMRWLTELGFAAGICRNIEDVERLIG